MSGRARAIILAATGALLLPAPAPAQQPPPTVRFVRAQNGDMTLEAVRTPAPPRPAPAAALFGWTWKTDTVTVLPSDSARVEVLGYLGEGRGGQRWITPGSAAGFPTVVRGPGGELILAGENARAWADFLDQAEAGFRQGRTRNDHLDTREIGRLGSCAIRSAPVPAGGAGSGPPTLAATIWRTGAGAGQASLPNAATVQVRRFVRWVHPTCNVGPDPTLRLFPVGDPLAPSMEVSGVRIGRESYSSLSPLASADSTSAVRLLARDSLSETTVYLERGADSLDLCTRDEVRQLCALDQEYRRRLYTALATHPLDEMEGALRAECMQVLRKTPDVRETCVRGQRWNSVFPGLYAFGYAGPMVLSGNPRVESTIEDGQVRWILQRAAGGGDTRVDIAFPGQTAPSIRLALEERGLLPAWMTGPRLLWGAALLELVALIALAVLLWRHRERFPAVARALSPLGRGVQRVRARLRLPRMSRPEAAETTAAAAEAAAAAGATPAANADAGSADAAAARLAAVTNGPKPGDPVPAQGSPATLTELSDAWREQIMAEVKRRSLRAARKRDQRLRSDIQAMVREALTDDVRTLLLEETSNALAGDTESRKDEIRRLAKELTETIRRTHEAQAKALEKEGEKQFTELRREEERIGKALTDDARAQVRRAVGEEVRHVRADLESTARRAVEAAAGAHVREHWEPYAALLGELRGLLADPAGLQRVQAIHAGVGRGGAEFERVLDLLQRLPRHKEQLAAVERLVEDPEALERAGALNARLLNEPHLVQQALALLDRLPDEDILMLIDPDHRREGAALAEEAEALDRYRCIVDDLERLPGNEREPLLRLFAAGDQLGHWIERHLELLGGVAGGAGLREIHARLPTRAANDFRSALNTLRDFSRTDANVFRRLLDFTTDKYRRVLGPVKWGEARQLERWGLLERNRRLHDRFQGYLEPPGTPGRLSLLAQALQYLFEALPVEQLSTEERAQLQERLRVTGDPSDGTYEFHGLLQDMASGVGLRYHPLPYYRSTASQNPHVQDEVTAISLTELVGRAATARPLTIVRTQRPFFFDAETGIYYAGHAYVAQ